MRESYGSHVKFVVMNSFSTSADTKEHLSKSFPDIVAEPDFELLQNKSPKINADTLAVRRPFLSPNIHLILGIHSIPYDR